MIDLNMAEIFAPMQIILVMVLALLLFGPKKLPELGKQIGTALRDLNKAKADMMKHLTLDHEPDHSYQPPPDESYYNTYDPSHYKAPPDLTSYTMVSDPPAIEAPEGRIAHVNLDAYTMVAPAEPTSKVIAEASPAATQAATPAANHDPGAPNERAAV